jgi:hypothetical protein
MAPGKVAFAVLVALLTRTATARAGDPAAADALFKEALALLDEGKWSEACPKFKASFDFDPSVSTLINLARCSEHDGKLATAWGQLAEAQRLNLDAPAGPRRSQLEAHIKKLSDALSTRLPRVRLVLAGAAPQAEVAMARDGVALPASALGQALPLDPGEHVVSVAAPGLRDRRDAVHDHRGAVPRRDARAQAGDERGSVPARCLLPRCSLSRSRPRPMVEAGPSGQSNRWHRGHRGRRRIARHRRGPGVGWLARRPRRSPLAASNRATRARPLKRPRSRTRRATREARS